MEHGTIGKGQAIRAEGVVEGERLWALADACGYKESERKKVQSQFIIFCRE